jgi:hypothetical protein
MTYHRCVVDQLHCLLRYVGEKRLNAGREFDAQENTAHL